jgi:hypothetical protein
MRLAGWTVDDPTPGVEAAPGDEQDLVPEAPSQGTPAWQRSVALARRRRGGH